MELPSGDTKWAWIAAAGGVVLIIILARRGQDGTVTLAEPGGLSEAERLTAAEYAQERDILAARQRHELGLEAFRAEAEREQLRAEQQAWIDRQTYEQSTRESAQAEADARWREALNVSYSQWLADKVRSQTMREEQERYGLRGPAWWNAWLYQGGAV